MHRKRVDPLNDRAALIEAIDGELRRALAAVPSGDFTARVRQRVAAEPGSTFWQDGRALAAVAAVSIAVWFAASVARPPAGDLRVSLAAPPHASAPQTRSIAAPSLLKQLVGEPGSRAARKAVERRRHDEALALEPAVTADVDRWASNAATRYVSSADFRFPMAETLDAAPAVASDVREPNEGLLEGRAADIALTYDFKGSER